MSFLYLPKGLINIILEYDGKIKYTKGNYINIIHKYDERYKIITHIISKKLNILKSCMLDNTNRNRFFLNFSLKI